MNTEPVILYPPTHEQSLPTFHVRDDLLEKLIEFLDREGFKIVEPPEHLSATSVAEVLLEEGTSLEALEKARGKFLASIA